LEGVQPWRRPEGLPRSWWSLRDENLDEPGSTWKYGYDARWGKLLLKVGPGEQGDILYGYDAGDG
jgi:hypothetical protein